MKKRSRVFVVGCICFLGVSAFLVGGFPTASTQMRRASKKTEDPMNLAYKTETEPQQIPPIDAAAPAAFETASFGLG